MGNQIDVLNALRTRLRKQLGEMEDALAVARQLEIGPGQFLDAVNQLESECSALADAIEVLRARPTPPESP